MKYIYCPHYGGLKESMEEAREFDSKDEMFEHIFNRYKSWRELTSVYMVDTDICEDTRVGWKDKTMICGECMDGSHFVIGWCATDYDKSVWEKNKKNYPIWEKNKNNYYHL